MGVLCQPEVMHAACTLRQRHEWTANNACTLVCNFVSSACARASAVRPDASRDFRAQKTVSLYFGVEGFCATMFGLESNL